MLRIVQGTIGSSSATHHQADRGRAEPPLALPGPAGRGEDDEGGGDERVLGAEHRGGAEEEAGQEPGQAPSGPAAPRRARAVRSQAQKKARIAAGRESIAGGSLMISPTEWMKGG